ncbi:MAG: hypothetical protein QM754_16640 [Tepidisphaeraceae bacterium]
MSSSTLSPEKAKNSLPPELSSRLSGSLGEQTVLDWAELDLNDANAFEQSYAVLTPRQLFVINGDVTVTDVDAIKEAKIVEGVGMDRLFIRTDESAVQLRYSRKYRKDVTRLNRKLGRLLPDPDAKREDRPEWLDRVEQQAEQADVCTNAAAASRPTRKASARTAPKAKPSSGD